MSDERKDLTAEESEAKETSSLRVLQRAQSEREREYEKKGHPAGKFTAPVQPLGGAFYKPGSKDEWRRALARMEALVEVSEATAQLARAAFGRLSLLKKDDHAGLVNNVNSTVNTLRKNARALMVITHDDVGSQGLTAEAKAAKANELQSLLSVFVRGIEHVSERYPVDA